MAESCVDVVLDVAELPLHLVNVLQSVLCSNETHIVAAKGTYLAHYHTKLVALVGEVLPPMGVLREQRRQGKARVSWKQDVLRYSILVEHFVGIRLVADPH